MTSDEAVQMISDEEKRLALEKGNEPKQGNKAYKFSMKDKKNRGSKAGVECYNCEKFGHYKNECPEPRNKETTEES